MTAAMSVQRLLNNNDQPSEAWESATMSCCCHSAGDRRDVVRRAPYRDSSVFNRYIKTIRFRLRVIRNA